MVIGMKTMYLRASLVVVFVILGVFFLSNLHKGIERFEPDQVRVSVKKGTFEELRSRYPEISVLDETTGLIGLPYGENQSYVAKFQKDNSIGGVTMIPVKPHFSFKLYRHAVTTNLQEMLDGKFGELVYVERPGRAYSINHLLPDMLLRSLSYFAPALTGGMVLGILFALMATRFHALAGIFDKLHVLIMSLPDVFLVVALQTVAILLSKAAGHNVILIMQYVNQIPFLIPFLSIMILPFMITYGTLRNGFEREWEQGYVKTAYSKGLTKRMVVLRHLFRNTLDDLLSVIPRIVSISVASLVIVEIMTGIFGLGGYAINPYILSVTSLPTTCILLAGFVLLTHGAVALLRNKLIISTKEGS